LLTNCASVGDLQARLITLVSGCVPPKWLVMT
jgi:hypothetical protein